MQQILAGFYVLGVIENRKYLLIVSALAHNRFPRLNERERYFNVSDVGVILYQRCFNLLCLLGSITECQKAPVQECNFIKVADYQVVTLLKITLLIGCFLKFFVIK